MKNKSLVFQIAAMLSSTMLFSSPGFSQPGVIDPATGQPAGPNPRTGAVRVATGAPGNLNMATGLPYPKPGDTSPSAALSAALETGTEVRQLQSDEKYEEALRSCVAFHRKFKAGGALVPLVPTWVELGRRFPKAKEALIEVRDHEVHEFSAGRGYAELFMEVSSINSNLGQDESTYALFNSVREKDPKLAEQCYPHVESLLMAKGEYQWCYDHMGDARDRFDQFRHMMNMQVENAKMMEARMAETRRRIAEINQRQGQANMPAPVSIDASSRIKRSAEVHFVNQTRQLIEILVATEHKAEAEKIHEQAMAALDDDRLKSAVTDAEAKIRK